MPKIVRFHETGDASVLKVEDIPMPEPGPGDVRIKVEAFGLNRAEVMFRMGMYLQEPSLPSGLGYEAAGVVDAVGSDVKSVKVGDRVSTIPGFMMGDHWAYGEVAMVPERSAVSYPENMSPQEGASIWMQYMTAYGALVEYSTIAKGDAVIITAASSSVGIAAIQMVKAAGGVAIATTRGADKKDFLLAQAADHVIVTNDENLSERVMDITSGKGAPIIFDPVAGPMIEDLANAAAQGGVIYEYGALSPDPTPYPLFPSLQKGLSIRGYTLFEIVANPDAFERGKKHVYEHLKSGAYKPVIDGKSFTLDQIADAHRHMESNTQLGKIVVTV